MRYHNRSRSPEILIRSGRMSTNGFIMLTVRVRSDAGYAETYHVYTMCRVFDYILSSTSRPPRTSGVCFPRVFVSARPDACHSHSASVLSSHSLSKWKHQFVQLRALCTLWSECQPNTFERLYLAEQKSVSEGGETMREEERGLMRLTSASDEVVSASKQKHFAAESSHFNKVSWFKDN